eukprot:GHUV01022498.1.p1 GENE.GHUV01022498.1~~GHUV01022498.1.p1  ORF type:complete len:257 (+),score=34.26 GHUV01022498.1:168-938(+)
MVKLPCFNASDSVEAQAAADELPAVDYRRDTYPVEAWKQGKLTIGWSGGGFLLPYFLGVYQSLAAMGIAHAGTPMAGSSAGSLVVGSIKAGLTLQQQFESFLDAGHDCRSNGVNGRLRQVLKTQLRKCLPEDAALRCSDGTCWISITQVIPRPCNKLYGGFSDKQALIRALLASCHLPRYGHCHLYRVFLRQLMGVHYIGWVCTLSPAISVWLPRHGHAPMQRFGDRSDNPLEHARAYLVMSSILYIWSGQVQASR